MTFEIGVVLGGLAVAWGLAGVAVSEAEHKKSLRSAARKAGARRIRRHHNLRRRLRKGFMV